MSARLPGIVFWGRGCWGGTLPHRPERRALCGAPAQQRLRGWARLPRNVPHPHRSSRSPDAHPPAGLAAEGDGGRPARLGLGGRDRPEAGSLRVSPEVPPSERPCPAPPGSPPASGLWGWLQPRRRRTPLAPGAGGLCKGSSAFACLRRGSGSQDLTVRRVRGSLSSRESRRSGAAASDACEWGGWGGVPRGELGSRSPGSEAGSSRPLCHPDNYSTMQHPLHLFPFFFSPGCSVPPSFGTQTPSPALAHDELQ